jgi:FkbM family methyltransferase
LNKGLGAAQQALATMAAEPLAHSGESAQGYAAAVPATAWPVHDARAMARDFLLWRHLRVLRARSLRHVHQWRRRLPSADRLTAPRTAYGVRMEANWDDRTYAYCHYGTYGTYLADLLGAIAQPFLFLDIGANQGLFSLIAARNPACAAIVALEPVAATFARLERNFALNGVGARACALNFGVSDSDGIRMIATRKAHSGVATLEDHLLERLPDAECFAVETRTMRGLAPHLGEDLPIFVKIDVEGHEATVIEQLLGAPEVVARVMAIFYEHDRSWTDTARIDTAFAQAGFAVVRQYGRSRHYDALATRIAAD